GGRGGLESVVSAAAADPCDPDGRTGRIRTILRRRLRRPAGERAAAAARLRCECKGESDGAHSRFAGAGPARRLERTVRQTLHPQPMRGFLIALSLTLFSWRFAILNVTDLSLHAFRVRASLRREVLERFHV